MSTSYFVATAFCFAEFGFAVIFDFPALASFGKGGCGIRCYVVLHWLLAAFEVDNS